MKLKNLVFSYYFMFSLSLFANIETKISPNIKLYTKGDTITLQCIISENLPPSEFILSKVENEKNNGLILNDRIIKVTSNETNQFTQYNIIFYYEITKIGEIDINKIKFTFINAEGKENISYSKAYKISSVKFIKKHIKLIILTSIVFLILLVTIISLKKKKEYQNIKMIIEKEKELALLKEKKEEEAISKIRVLSKYIIAGEYNLYCKEFLLIFCEYFTCLYPELQLKPDLFEMKNRLLNFFNEPILKSKINKFFELIEEIQFTGQSPQQSDLDRLQILFKEILTQHREYKHK